MNDTTQGNMTQLGDALIEMHPVKSSQIKEIGYDEPSRVMGIRFQRGDALYRYNCIEPNTFKAFKESSSLGRFLFEMIKPNVAQYPYVRITENADE